MWWRVLLVMAALALMLYGAMCVSLYIGQRNLIYHPEASWLVKAPPDFVLERQGVHLRGWVMHPGQPRALLYFGGNGERVEDTRESLAAWFPDRTIYVLAYRSFGASEGEPNEAALIGDAIALFDHVAPHHTDVAVIGRSLGSGVAVQLGAARPIEKLILVTPFDSIVRVASGFYPWVPVDALMKDRYESWRYADKLHCPVLLIRAGNDEVIPASRTQALADALARAGAPWRMQTVPEAGHNDIQAFTGYRVGLKRFLQ